MLSTFNSTWMHSGLGGECSALCLHHHYITYIRWNVTFIWQKAISMDSALSDLYLLQWFRLLCIFRLFTAFGLLLFSPHTKSHYSMINRCLNEKKKSRNLLHKAAEKKSTVRLNTSEVSLSAFVIDYNNIFWFLWIHETCKNLHETPGIGKWLIQPPKYVRVI